jgi:hypothetical protein
MVCAQTFIAQTFCYNLLRSGDQFLVYYTEHGTMTFSRGLIEHWACNAEIGLQAAQDLGVEAEILAPDRLSLHPPSDEWDWKEYHRRYVELLVEKGLA